MESQKLVDSCLKLFQIRLMFLILLGFGKGDLNTKMVEKINEFERINWLPVSNRVDQCLSVTAYNFKNALSPK